METPLSTSAASDPVSSLDQPSTSTATRGSLLVIFLTVMTDLLGFAMVLPLLPVYAAQFQSDETGLIVGLLMSVFSIMQFLFSPFWGRLSDRVGRRPVILVGLFGSTLFYALFGVATSMKSISMLFATRIGAGIACATIPTAQAYIADCTTPATRARGMALIGAAFGAGFCFGPLLGAAALVSAGDADISPWPGYAAAIFSGIAFLLALVQLPESLKSKSESAFSVWRSLTDVWENPTVVWLMLVAFLSITSFGGLETTLSRLLKDMGVSYKEVLYAFAGVGLTLTISQGLLVRKLSTRIPEGRMAWIGCVISLIGFVLLYAVAQIAKIEKSGATPPVSVFVYLFASVAVEIVGFSFITPSLNSLISRATDPAKQGSVAGVNQSVGSLARIFGPLLAMPLYVRSPGLQYGVSIPIMLLGLAILTVATRRPKA